MTRKRLYILVIGLSLLGYAWLGWNAVNYSTSAAVPTVCLFKEVTHLPCPSCGATRALMVLMKGDVGGSLLINPFGFLLALGLAIVPLWVGVDLMRKNESFFRTYFAAESLIAGKSWIAALAVVAVALNWAWNIAKGL